MTPLLSARDLELRHNDRVLLDRASLGLAAGDRMGLVGRNGAGKTTLLRILSGEVPPDGGEVVRRRGLRVGYLPQAFDLPPETRVGEVIRQGAGDLLELIAEYEALPGHTARHDEIEAALAAADGWNLETRAQTVANQLACPDPDRPVGELSGGEQRRVALARALVGRPDVLILDEPTNHLDAESVAWVTSFLSGYPGALLVVTHDRYFLDELATGIVELRNGVLERYEGNYTDYLIQRAERLATEEMQEHKRQMFLRRELEWARRRPKAQTSKSQARKDRLAAVVDQGPPQVESDLELVIPPPPPLGNRVVEAVGLGASVGGRWLFRGLDLAFGPGTRIGITGRNGLGKTTLVRMLLGEQPPTEGEVRIGALTRFNYMDQARMQVDDTRTLLEEVADGSEWVQWGESRLSLRGYLKRFLFPDDRITTRVDRLSGGERSRLVLAKVLKRGGNFLVLDEPTNDLDLPTLRVLEEALAAFPGCVVAVSHDRYFLNRVATEIVAFEGDGRVVHSVGNYDYYEEKRARVPDFPAAPAPVEARVAAPPAPTAPRRRLSFKEQRELEGIEPAIAASEEQVAQLEARLADPEFHRTQGARTPELIAELERLRQETTRLYQRWEELEQRRGGDAGDGKQ